MYLEKNINFKLSLSTENSSFSEMHKLLQLGYLLSEKCELEKAQEIFLKVLKRAKDLGEVSTVMEALSQLLRLAGEACDETLIKEYEKELDDWTQRFPTMVHPMSYYCKAYIATSCREWKKAQAFFLKYMREVKSQSFSKIQFQVLSHEEYIARGWTLLALCLLERGFIRRADWLLKVLLHRYEQKNLRTVNGFLYLFQGYLFEKTKKHEEALSFYQKSHTSFLAEHNWYYHLYVLLAYARISRLQQDYRHAYFYLNLIDKATSYPLLSALKQEALAEKKRLEQDAVDLFVDGGRAVVRTKEKGKISLRKQYVLLGILEALSKAHVKNEDTGLSKSEIINKVWQEKYLPKVHDNKLYYNINRIRKLIEPNAKEPRYLLNWKEGYRLAPGLRVRWVDKTYSKCM
ncbi:MAG: winged helix-turn-helix domain-containing protein [Bdellovibrio sp.]|nr:winged helix-turn-helix domain-containing protein [Bdellovibrio sp.]